MASKPRDASTVTPGDVDANDRPVKEKRRVSTSGKDKSERRDRDRDRDRDRERDREHRNSMPSPSALSSLLSHRSSHHKSSSGSAPRSSKTRTSESDLVYPSSSSLSRGQRRKPTDGETTGSSSKPHRSSSANHKMSSGSRRRTKDKDGSSSERREKRSSAMTGGGTSSSLPDVDEHTKPRSASLSISSSTGDLVPEMSRSRERLPYPSVNKAFSRESVISREDLSAPSRASAGSVKHRTGDPLTPDATDLSAGAAGMQRSKSSSANDSRPGSRATRKDKSSAAYSSVPSSRKNSHTRASSRHHDRPPSPPDTNLSSTKKAHEKGSSEDKDDDTKDKAKDAKDSDYEDDDKSELDPGLGSNTHKSQTSRVRIRKSRTPSTLGGSVTTAHDLSKSAPSDNSMVSSQATYTVGARERISQATASKPDARRRSPAEASDADFSPESAQESSSPKTPNPEASPKFFASGADWKQPPPPPHPHPHLQSPPQRFPSGTAAAAAAAVAADRLYTPSPAPGSPRSSELSATESPEDDGTSASVASAVPPAPPPPPPLTIVEVPRIDYLMQNGGLPNPIPKNFLAVLPRQNFARPMNPPLQGAETLFQPFFNLLNQYNSVLSGHGSVAVATGHRTVARRLLDRLENVFSRELPAEGCSCVVCESSGDVHRGLGWGEVLERVSGRVDLPTWPPVNISELEKRLDAAAVAAAAVGVGAGAAAGLPVRPSSPVKIDPDIAEEFREHYLRQNKKVRASVDRWMRDCASAPASAPQEIDDETLAFAILTNLGQDERPLFNALLSGSRDLVPTVRAPTPMRKPRQNFIIKTGLAIQRLYRLGTAPRDAETTLYLVKNPSVHDLLHTIADIHPSEWEILISGRFDGFLWSGADTNDDDVATPIAGEPSGFFPATSIPSASRGPTPAMGLRGPTPMSRGPTPASGFGGLASNPVSRNATPASFISNFSNALSSASTNATRQAVSTDEEAEVAALAEIEREIYLGMEALEDAFEVLHRRAEMVRTGLRQRSAGLSMRLQQRRVGGLGGAAAQIDVLPQSGGGGPSGNDFERPAWSVPGTPAPGGGMHVPVHPHEFSMDPYDPGAASEADWDAGDDFFELKPEDSASNISSSQHRRPKRRSERRTPAPIEEEDE
ncbi:hypothetical protein SPBR_04599 [Sporothrix brasiliensis 5110]|uniref:5-methylcytosine g t mismatch-specific dna n=1 Tax=Sporothrix brasiliensis 5110 TaxID=1398154 RepID=A0A0C2IKA6_9PEZI|nr:uncharacterized protein SPBR_04599 [Sporothrix brasiliensis 5110]KIH87425.1 hypothetical protein SPBR_04599 [Sporothrix brasiliensis 5110]